MLRGYAPSRHAARSVGRCLRAWVLVAGGLLSACDARPTVSEAAEACDALCVDGGFSGGVATAYGNALDTCVCSGLGDGLTASACADYCLAFGVEPSGAQLTTDADADDTCTCNGAAP